MKFKSDVAKLSPENSFIWPFNARCTPTKAPARTANTTAKCAKSIPANLSQTETRTANMVTSAALTLRTESDFGPPPVNPIRSTISEVAVWPAMEATE